MQTYTVYVIQNAAGRRYVGLTTDLQRRLAEHNSDDRRKNGGHFTFGKGPWYVVHSETDLAHPAAIARERWLKSGTGRRSVG